MKSRRSVCGYLLLVAVSLLNYASAQNQSPSDQPQNASQPRKLKIKRGSRDDVAAIGTRKIDGMDWYSLQSEIEIGRKSAQEIDAAVKLVDDPAITSYVDRVGQDLVRNSDAKVAFSIKVVDSNEVVAFSLPGGFLYVSSGLILAADKEAELAGVMAHAVAHVAARHVTRQMTRAQLMNYTQLPLIMTGTGLCKADAACERDNAMPLARPITFLKFWRLFEAEADYFGIQYLYKAGYDPDAFVAFLERRKQLEKPNPQSRVNSFSTHPPLAERITTSKKEIAGILPPRGHSIVDTPEFQQIKARVASWHSHEVTSLPATESDHRR